MTDRRYASVRQLERVLAETGGRIINAGDALPAGSRRKERTEAEKALAKAQREMLQNKFADLWRQQAADLELDPEYPFHPARFFRADFRVVGTMVLIEIEGGTRQAGKNGKKSRHTTHSGYSDDCEKYNAATMLGFQVIRLTSTMIDAEHVGQIIKWVRSLI